MLADRLAAAATALLDAAGPAASAARLPFDEQVRREWAYWPTARPGVAFSDLDRAGVKAAHRLLSEALALPAFTRAVAVAALDEVLDVVEGHAGDRRHRDDYWVAVFGEPGASRWGWRFEGHHVSVTATVVGGDVRLTPLFLGANPAVVTDGGRVVSAPLGPEEELGFELLHALPAEQRSSAVVADEAPRDIVTRNRPRLDDGVPGDGVPLSALAGAAAGAAAALLDVYLGRFPDGAGRPDPDGAAFAWAGADRPGAGHYYRIAGPRLLIELDNTQNGANHVHTVVRDPAADFGDDVLGDHLRLAH